MMENRIREETIPNILRKKHKKVIFASIMRIDGNPASNQQAIEVKIIKALQLKSRSTNCHDKPYKCDTCKTRFTRIDYLKVHLRVHTEERRCGVCDKNFASSCHLRDHVRSHTGERPFECTVCEKRFTRMNTLKDHLRVHTGEKLYKCDVCQKRFPQSTHLTRHIRTHTGERPYSCSFCKKSFGQSTVLRKHIKSIHSSERRTLCVFLPEIPKENIRLRSAE